MVVDLSFDVQAVSRNLNLSQGDREFSSFLRRLVIAAAIIVPTIVEFICISSFSDSTYIAFCLYYLFRAQALTIIGAVLCSLFGFNLEYLGKMGQSFIEVHTLSSLSYFVFAQLIALVEMGVDENSSTGESLRLVALVLNALGTGTVKQM